MSAIHGRSTSVLVNQFDLSNQLKTFSAKNAAPELECTAFQDTARQYISNFREGSLSLEGFFHQDPVALNGTDDVFQDLKDDSSPAVVTVSPEGATIGKRTLLCNAVEIKIDVSSPADNYISAMADFRGEVDQGVVLSAALAAVTTTGNGTAHDNAVSSANGGVAHLHITAASGTTPTNTTKIQHSTDSSTWVDLLTFTAKTGVGSERKTVTGTVNRYVREVHTLGGSSPSFTQLIAFARL